MKILLCSATLLEIHSIIEHLEKEYTKKSFTEYSRDTLSIHPFVTGVGSTSTSFSLARHKEIQDMDFVLHIGICGSFDPSLSIGDCVEVVAEVFADLGAEEPDGNFLDLVQMNLLLPKQYPYTEGWIAKDKKTIETRLTKVKGITVNTCSGTDHTIGLRKNKWKAQVESMEGAGLFYACRMIDIPFISIRSISNYVEPRDKTKWNIPLALKNLHNCIVDLLDNRFNNKGKEV